MNDLTVVGELIDRAKTLARQYYVVTGRPLGITGEVAEVEAVRALGLELAPVRQAGYDAIRRNPDGSITRFQIKGRCIGIDATHGHRMGSIRVHHEWDAVLLVVLSQDFELLEIHEASRPVIEAELRRPGSKARTERSALGVAVFKRIGRQLWPVGGSRIVDRAMTQDRETGATGNEFGHATAQRIATIIGAEMLGKASNEATLDGRRIVIKCASPGTTSVGVLYPMLDRIDAVVGAFQRPDGSFDLFEMTPELYRRLARDSQSRNANGRVGLVSRQAFRSHGTMIRTVTVTSHG